MRFNVQKKGRIGVVAILILALTAVWPTAGSLGQDAGAASAKGGALAQILAADEAYYGDGSEAAIAEAIEGSPETAGPEDLPSAKVSSVRSLAGGEMAADNTLIPLKKKERYTVTATLPGIAVADDAAAQAYASANLSLDLTRKREDSPLIDQPQGAKISDQFAAGIYTGDKLTAWRVWSASGTADPARFFTTPGVAATRVDANTIQVQFDFENDYFFGDPKNNSNRNVMNAIIGDYDLTIVDGGAAGASLASMKMKVNLYNGYHTYPETWTALMGLQKEAAAKGFDFAIESLGSSEGGLPQYAVVFGKKGKAKQWLNLTNYAEENPAEVQAKLPEIIDSIALPLFINNVHPDETPGPDAMIRLLQRLIREDYIDTSFIDGYGPAGSDPGGYISPAIEKWAHNYGRDTLDDDTQGRVDVNTFYDNKADRIRVSDLLTDVFFVMVPNENPDGRASNARRNANGFDLNRDGSFQTQRETQQLEPYLASWNPIIMDEYHGFYSYFLLEPCTPPHEQNMEYDLMIENIYRGGEAYGNRAVSSVKDTYGKAQEAKNGYSFSQYTIALRDFYDPEKGWEAWDDFGTSYGPTYAMINSGTLGYTIEIPYTAEGSVDLLYYGTLGQARFMQAEKQSLLNNQLEIFRRGVENIDVSTAPIALNKLEKYYVDKMDNLLNEDQWRPKYKGAGESGKYFPEFYVIPMDAAAQKNPAEAAAFTEYLIRNDVKIGRLNRDTVIDGVSYRQGSVIVDMHQAKRNYANAILWRGYDSSFFDGLYSESVVNFPQLRGFDVVPVAKTGALPADHVTPQADATQALSTLTGNTADYEAVLVRNNGRAAAVAVNDLLKTGGLVGLVTTGPNKGEFLVDRATWATVSAKFPLVGSGVKKAGGDVYRLKKPTLYIPGLRDDYNGSKNANPYWGTWFANGFGSNRLILSSMEYRNYDVMTFQNQFGFDVATDPAQASIVVSSMYFDLRTANANRANEQAALDRVLSGTPYIAMGGYPIYDAVLGTQIFKGLNYEATLTDYAESLHHVVYQSDSVITAPKRARKDDIVYNYEGGRVLKVPEGARILYKTGTMADKFHIAGCFPAVSDENLGDKVEAFTYAGKNGDGKDIDVTLFANSMTRKSHQQDDTAMAATAIYLKSIDPLAKMADYSGQELPKYTVTFRSAGGSAVQPSTVESGTKITLPAPTRKGYKFLGWYDGQTKAPEGYTVSKTVILTARWASTNNTLKSLKGSTGTLTPKFAAAKTAYQLKLARNKTQVKLTVAKTSKYAKVMIKVSAGKYKTATTATIKLAKGKSKTAFIRVYAQSGAFKTYQVKVTRSK